MKVGIIGSGLVGATAAYAMVLRRVVSEAVLVDIDEERARAEAADILHAVPFIHPVDVSAGGYADLAGSGVVIITAGVSQKPGQSRLELLERNAEIMRQVVPQVLRHAPEAVLLVTTNPVDVMTHVAAEVALAYGVPSTRVIGSGTTLDTARFRALLGNHLDVDPQHVHGYVVGEHGDSEVLTWSIVDIGGLPLDAFVRLRHLDLGPAVRDMIEGRVREAAYKIIAGKGATYYGVAAALARIVDVILHDHRAILTICTPTAEVAGVRDVTVSLPHLVGRTGVIDTLPLQLDDQETEALRESAQIIRDLLDGQEGEGM
ncbi:MAG: L-lactate dehydrogenase [Anaerolineae bacterium]|jgi:L-lactate dehydrogenase